MSRLERVERMLFAAGAHPITAELLAWQTGVRISGVRHVLRCLERSGRAERVAEVTTGDGRPLWRWKD